MVSIYGDFYPTNIATNYDPDWGQSGFGMVDPAFDPGTGNTVLAYPNFNYQGTELTTTDLSGMDYLYFDVWTSADPASTLLQVSPVLMGPLQFLVDVPFQHLNLFSDFDKLKYISNDGLKSACININHRSCGCEPKRTNLDILESLYRAHGIPCQNRIECNPQWDCTCMICHNDTPFDS